MDILKSYSRRSFWSIMMFVAVFSTAFGLAFYFGIDSLCAKALTWLQLDPAAPEFKNIIERIGLKRNELKLAFIAAVVSVAIVCGLLLWFFLRISCKRLVKQRGIAQVASASRKPLQAANARKERINHDRRIFLHLFSVFQREGRLADFFAEDLSLYDDEQIGAAVRTIQEDCRTTMHKYLAPRAVIDQPEGEEVTIEAGFDPAAIKLTGNVTGEPPFRGILRHKGWQATKSDLPELSESGNSQIISPAEVEIQ